MPVAIPGFLGMLFVVVVLLNCGDNNKSGRGDMKQGGTKKKKNRSPNQNL